MKMKHLLVLILLSSANLFAQEKWFTKTGTAYFISHTDVIDIDGTNRQVVSFLDTKTGEVVCGMLIKGFEFTLATAAEHFNETYMESHLYPKANFKGKIVDNQKIDWKKNGKIEVMVEGDLTIHGVTRQIKVPVSIEINGETIVGKTQFKVAIADYNIKVPAVVENRVAKVVDVKIDCTYKPHGAK